MARNRSTTAQTEPPSDFQKLILVVMGIILPPLPVFLLLGNTIFTMEFLVSVLLTLLGHLPGVLFAVYFILVKFPQTSRNEGYIRINDDENQLGVDSEHTETGHDSGIDAENQEPTQPRQHFGIDDAEHGKIGHPGAKDSGDVKDSGDAQAPPDYEDIVGSSNIAPLTDTKDNKVQE